MSCLACDLASGRIELPGGRIYETDGWIVEHTVGALGLGTLIVKPKRHVLHVADLDAEEAAELGPLLRASAAVVTELIRPERIYVCLWSHAGGVPVHIHFVVQPITRAEMDDLDALGPQLQAALFSRGERPAHDDVEAFAARARVSFAS